jgi:thioredoxin reductase (NADPH)
LTLKTKSDNIPIGGMWEVFQMYDVIIIGKGPAGISASLYTSRANLNTLIIGKTSSLSKSHMVDNYYGFENGIRGDELLNQGEKQTVRFGTHILEEDIIALEMNEDGTYIVKTKNNDFNAKAVLLATGSEKKKIPVKNLDRFEGKGVHYCITCDGYFYRGKKLALMGYNEYGLHGLEEMKLFTQNITLLSNGNEPIAGFGGVIINKKKIVSVEGTEYLDKVVFDDGTEEYFEGMFISYGTASSVDFARKLGIIVNDNIIEVDNDQKTNAEGLFAAGDCACRIKQVAVAVGQGAVAGMKISEYIRNMGR